MLNGHSMRVNAIALDSELRGSPFEATRGCPQVGAVVDPVRVHGQAVLKAPTTHPG